MQLVGHGESQPSPGGIPDCQSGKRFPDASEYYNLCYSLTSAIIPNKLTETGTQAQIDADIASGGTGADAQGFVTHMPSHFRIDTVGDYCSGVLATLSEQTRLSWRRLLARPCRRTACSPPMWHASRHARSFPSPSTAGFLRIHPDCVRSRSRRALTVGLPPPPHPHPSHPLVPGLSSCRCPPADVCLFSFCSPFQRTTASSPLPRARIPGPPPRDATTSPRSALPRRAWSAPRSPRPLTSRACARLRSGLWLLSQSLRLLIRQCSTSSTRSCSASSTSRGSRFTSTSSSTSRSSSSSTEAAAICWRGALAMPSRWRRERS